MIVLSRCIAVNAISYVCSLKACGTLGAKIMGQRIHTETSRKALEKELLVGSTLIDISYVLQVWLASGSTRSV